MASKKAGLGNSPRGKTAAGNIILRPPHRIDLVTREFIMRHEVRDANLAGDVVLLVAVVSRRVEGQKTGK